MATDPLVTVRSEVRRRVAEIRSSGPRLSPLDLHARMEAIRQLAAVNGLAALEGLARSTAQRALLPGHRLTMQSSLDHVEDALHGRSENDCTAILAALAVRFAGRA